MSIRFNLHPPKTMDEAKTTLFRGSAVILFFSVGAGFMGYLVRILYAHQLTIDEYGRFYALITFTSMIYGIKHLGMHQSLIKFIPEYLAQDKPGKVKGAIAWVTTLQVAITLLLSIVLWILSNWLAAHFFNHPASGKYLRLLIIGYCLLSLVDLFRVIMQGFQRHFWYALFEFLTLSTILAISLILFYLVGLKGIIVSVLSYTVYPVVLIGVYYYVFFRKTFPEIVHVRNTLAKGDKSRILRFGLPLILIVSGGLILDQIDIVMLTYFKNAHDVSMYNASMPACKIILYLALALSAVYFPMASELLARQQIDRLKSSFRKVVQVTCLLLIPVTTLFIIFPGAILELMFGVRYTEAARSLQVLAVGMFMWSFVLIGFSLLKSLGKSVFLVRMMLLGAGLNVILNLFLIPAMSYLGASLSTTICYLLMGVFLARHLAGFLRES